MFLPFGASWPSKCTLCSTMFQRKVDHLVLFPTLILKSFGERMMLSAIQVLSIITWRPWKIADRQSRECIGIGAFNLTRSEVYRSIGGFEAQRMEVLEDLRLGYDIKQHGFRQRIVFDYGFNTRCGEVRLAATAT